MKILLPQSTYRRSDPETLMQAAVNYMNDLLNTTLSDDELEQEVKQGLFVYFVDFYDSQVCNGGLAQFFANSGFDERIHRLVREGLTAMGATQHRELFEQALAILERDTSYDLTEAQLTDLDNQISALNQREKSLFNQAVEYLLDPKHVQIVADEAYHTTLEAQCDAIAPDWRTRVEETESPSESEHSRTRPTEIVTALCDQHGLQLLQINAVDYGQDLVSDDEAERNAEHQILYYHFSTAQGYFYAIDDGETAILMDGTLHTLIGYHE
jgi:hypothetical protein